MDRTLDPSIPSWVPTAEGHRDFPVQNLPWCVFSLVDESPDAARGGVRIGDYLLDLGALADARLLNDDGHDAARAASASSLNEFFALGAAARVALRTEVHRVLTDPVPGHTSAVRPMLHAVDKARLHLPATVGDFTDFYAGIHHARNVGALFRPTTPLLPNYKWVPVGYHGRASTVHLTGVPVHRPRGQLKYPEFEAPIFEPTRRLDYETELGIWAGDSPAAGRIPTVSEAAEQIAGFCLLNDWSARDVQTWEYQPLGPFLAKNFATSISAYVVTPEALAPYRCAMVRPMDDPTPLPYLRDPLDAQHGGLDVQIDIAISSAQMRRNAMPDLLIASVSTSHLYWSVAQLMAHHRCGGCELRPGDLLGTGTISSPQANAVGSMLELTKDGALVLPTGETRTFLSDGDEIALIGRASRAGHAPIGFGECRARVLPPLPMSNSNG